MFGGTVSSSCLHLIQFQEYTRAALIACFQLKIRLAVDILSKGADQSPDIGASNLRMAAIALSGFSFEKGAIWRTQCTTAQTQITDPHLRTIFTFLLIAESSIFEKILVITCDFQWEKSALKCNLYILFETMLSD